MYEARLRGANISEYLCVSPLYPVSDLGHTHLAFLFRAAWHRSSAFNRFRLTRHHHTPTETLQARRLMTKETAGSVSRNFAVQFTDDQFDSSYSNTGGHCSSPFSRCNPDVYSDHDLSSLFCSSMPDYVVFPFARLEPRCKEFSDMSAPLFAAILQLYTDSLGQSLEL